jgi:hypothetical protein
MAGVFLRADRLLEGRALIASDSLEQEARRFSAFIGFLRVV